MRTPSAVAAAAAATSSPLLPPLPPARQSRRRFAAAAAAQSSSPSVGQAAAKCFLVGVGPGGLEHTTRLVGELLRKAEAVVFDDLGAAEALLEEADAEAEAEASLLRPVRRPLRRYDVGKRGGRAASMRQEDINELLVKLCLEPPPPPPPPTLAQQQQEEQQQQSLQQQEQPQQQQRVVVRLKGGCPSTFSRVASECRALARAGVPFEMVPGVSTATAAPVLAGLPLTDLSLGAGAYAVASAHDAAAVDWPALSRIPTLVLLMGGRSLGGIVAGLVGSGWPSSTPVAVIKAAGAPEQRVWLSTVAAVERDTADGVPLSPCVIVVGQVAGLPAAWR